MVIFGMDREELIKHIRARVERARRLAQYVNDSRTTEALLQMAQEGESDLEKLEAEQAANQTNIELPSQT